MGVDGGIKDGRVYITGTVLRTEMRTFSALGLISKGMPPEINEAQKMQSGNTKSGARARLTKEISARRLCKGIVPFFLIRNVQFGH
jgi:hypothetical protein